MNIRHPGDLLTGGTRTVFLTCVSLSFLSGPAPAQTMWFQDDFDVPQLSSQWHPVTGAWQVKDGILAVTTREYDALAASTFYTYPLTPYAIEVRLRGIRAGVYFSLDDTTTKNYSHMVRFDEKSILTGYFNGAGEFVATNMFDVPAAPKEWTTLKVVVDPERHVLSLC